MHSHNQREPLRKKRPVFLPVLCLILIFSILSPARAQDAITSRKNLMKDKGHLQSISIGDRTAVIDNRLFQLAEDLIVKDKSGSIMMPHQYRSLSFVDLVEYTKIKGTNTILEIKIVRYAS